MYNGKPQDYYYGRTVVNAHSKRNVPGKAKKERSRAITTMQNLGGWQIRCGLWKGKRNTRSVRELLNSLLATLTKI